MQRVLAVVVTGLIAVVLLAAPASAHVRVVDTPGVGEPASGWVGSPAEGIPGEGEGLILGGPEGTTTLAPAHGGGLNTACEALRANGEAAVDIFGPPTPAGCPHGT